MKNGPHGLEPALSGINLPQGRMRWFWLSALTVFSGGRLPVVPVKTSSPIPKEKIFECMTEINKVTLKAPVSIGDVVIEDVLGTGVNIVATNND